MEAEILMRPSDHCTETNSNHKRASSSPLSMHKDSQVISKLKPKIRIIHIFAPEIIKTDVENFRELVQRLTGKPTEGKAGNNNNINNNNKMMCRRVLMKKNKQKKNPGLLSSSRVGFCQAAVKNNNNVGLVGIGDDDDDQYDNIADYCIGERLIKDEEEDQEEEENLGSFFGGFGDLDSFIQELGEFPLLTSANSSHMDVFEGHF